VVLLIDASEDAPPSKIAPEETSASMVELPIRCK